MSILRQSVKLMNKVAFGDTLLPQEFTVGLTEPQSEVSLWLDGIGHRRDVTGRVTSACTAPLTICIALHEEQPLNETGCRNAVLKFSEPGGQQRLLGEIRLTFNSAIAIGDSQFILFRARGSTNYCLPKTRLWAHYLLQAYSRLRRNDPADIKMTLLEERAASITFIRPHPLSLVSVGDKTNGNIFPMNLMGDLGNGYFGFALRELRRAAHLVEGAGRMALSGIPVPQCSLVFRLVDNHKKESIDWSQLPFETKPSATFGVPVPVFATRVREMQIEKVLAIGSHRFFIARIVSDETYAAVPQACVVHGFYQFWRLKGDHEMLKASLAQDLINKRGL
jgi:hypothetical protein